MCGSGQVQGVQEMKNSGIFWLDNDIDHIVTLCHQIYQIQEGRSYQVLQSERL